METIPVRRPMFSAKCAKELAAERARILVGCYRRSDANDPEIYARAAVAVLMRYPEKIVIAVTEPATGLPSKLKWLPSIAEIVEACEEKIPKMSLSHRHHEMLAAPDMDRSIRPSLEELREKYGPTWGLKGMQ